MTFRKALSALLVAATLLVTIPLPAGSSEPKRVEAPYLFRNGERLYHIDLRRHSDLWSVIAGRRGSASLTLHVLRDEALEHGAAGAIFVLGQDHPLDAVAPLITAERPDLLAPNGGLVDPGSWDEVVTWNLSSNATEIVSTLVAGRDRVTTRFPWTLADQRTFAGAAGEPIEIEVNGALLRLRPELVARFRQAVESGEAIRDEELPPQIQILAGRFDDLPGFMNRVQGLYLADARLRSSEVAPVFLGDAATHGCTAICIGCVASVVLSIGAYLALVASCGSALVTGGATAIACIAAFVGVQGTHFAVLGSCGRCYDCTREPGE